MENILKRIPISIYACAVLAGILLVLCSYFLPPLYLAALIGGAGFLVLLCKKPVVGLYTAIASIAVLQSNTVLFLIMALCVGAYLLRYLFHGSFTLPAVSAQLPLALFVLFSVLAAVTSVVPQESAVELAVLLVSIGLYFILSREIETREDMNAVIMVLAVSAALAALHGIYQYMGGAQTDAAWVDKELNPDLKTRVFSTFTNPNVFAEYLALVLPLLAALFLSTSRIIKKALFLLIGTPILIALLLTASRSSWLGAAFCVFVIIFFTKRPLLLLGIPLAMTLPFILPPSIMHRLSTISLNDTSITYRMIIYECTGMLISMYWKTGVGLGYEAFRTVFANFWGTTGVIPYHSHNTYLQLMAESGIGAFMAFIWFVFRKIQHGILSIRGFKDKYYNMITICCVGAISGLMLTGMGEHVFFRPKIVYTFWIVLGILSASILNTEAEDRNGKQV